jgi:hypothetical protein
MPGNNWWPSAICLGIAMVAEVIMFTTLWPPSFVIMICGMIVGISIMPYGDGSN